MTKYDFSTEYDDCYEYHGNTTIELTRRQGKNTLWRFDTVQEAADFFNAHCSADEATAS